FLGLFCRNVSERAPNKWHAAGKQIPKGDAEGVDVRTRIDPRFSRLSKLLWTSKSRSADETGLCLFGTEFRVRRQNFRHTVINHFNNWPAAAWIRLQHDIRWLDVPVDDGARFGGSQSARDLLNNFQIERKRQWTFPPDFGFECFALDQLHHIETLGVLFT